MLGCLPSTQAMGRVNRPSLMVYGGAIQPGRCSQGGPAIDIVSGMVFAHPVPFYKALIIGIHSVPSLWPVFNQGN